MLHRPFLIFFWKILFQICRQQPAKSPNTKF